MSVTIMSDQLPHYVLVAADWGPYKKGDILYEGVAIRNVESIDDYLSEMLGRRGHVANLIKRQSSDIA
jgi:hypothetical protein